MGSNLCHTYVTGNTFPNICGGYSESLFGCITYIDNMTPLMQQRWPWMKGLWSVDDYKVNYGYFDTLEEAKAFAQLLWPGCGFKTPQQFREENEYDK